MTVFRPWFPAPIVQIDEFLSDDGAAAVLEECIMLERVYSPARIFDGPHATKIDTSFRKNDVLYLDDTFKNAPEKSAILGSLKKTIWEPKCLEIWHQGYTVLDDICSATAHEMVVSRYGNCDFYGQHRDTRYDHIQRRRCTIVYYVNRQPERFTGGAITFAEDDQKLTVTPKHNRAVVFPSHLLHEVEKVRLESEAWADGRFSINYWMGFLQ